MGGPAGPAVRGAALAKAVAKIQGRVKAAIEKMRSEGKAPQEIRKAVQTLRERARQAIQKQLSSKPQLPKV